MLLALLACLLYACCVETVPDVFDASKVDRLDKFLNDTCNVSMVEKGEIYTPRAISFTWYREIYVVDNFGGGERV